MFIVLIGTMGKDIGRSFKYNRSKYQVQHSRNLYYHFQQIIHHIQLLRHEQLYHINLNIKTVLQYKTRRTSQIQIISTPM